MFKVSFYFSSSDSKSGLENFVFCPFQKTLKYQFSVLSISEFACDMLDGKGNVQLSSKSILFKKKMHPAVIISA